jgi:hypothetical protein
MNDAVETKVIGKYKIEIFPDDSPYSPREDDNLGTMVCFHSRYNLGDKHDFSVEEARKMMQARQILVLPLYLYDHSGITMNTTGFSCPWDSGMVGFIYVEKSKVREEYGWKRITQKRKETILGYLKGEVQIYDQYLTGDVYGYRITDTTNDEEVDSCWGYYGDDNCMTEAIGIVEYMIKKDKQEQVELELK